MASSLDTYLDLTFHKAEGSMQLGIFVGAYELVLIPTNYEYT